MKKYLFIALTALGFAACAEKMDDNSPVQKGELEESYIAINLMSADVDTRAATDSYGYEEGTTAERAIETAYFFFFDANGNPFNVNATANAPGGEKNYLQLTIGETTGKVDPNVSDIKEAILILNTYKGVYPSKIVAVINWVPTANTYSLTDLHAAYQNIGNDANGYVMSNSVYMDGAGNFVDAVPLTAANIKTTEAEALATPVDIYVERTAAKVVLTASGKVAGTQNIFDTQKNSSPMTLSGTISDVDVYVQLHGWELYNDYPTSSILKVIEKWDIATLGLTWNDIPYYRCYWAKSQVTPHADSFSWQYSDEHKVAKGFQTNYGFNVGASADYNDRTTYTYCGENTNQVLKDGEVITNDPRTKVILKGQLMKKNSENYEPLELARWYGTEYAGNEALRTAVANSLKYILYHSSDGTTFDPIAPEDLQCVAGSAVGAKAYEVGFQLSNSGAENTWYKYTSATGYQSLGTLDGDANKIATNEILKSVEPALVYTEGNTYYIVDIEHLGTAGAKYGVVRNHVYQIDIESIKGYGSPVYNGLANIITPPEYPDEDEASYVAARINVLSWKVVKQGVDIGQ